MPANETDLNLVPGYTSVKSNDGKVLFNVELAEPVKKSGDQRTKITIKSMSFEEAVANVKTGAQMIIEELCDLGLEEIEVTLGLKMSGDAGFVVAKASAEANFSIKVKWKKDS